MELSTRLIQHALNSIGPPASTSLRRWSIDVHGFSASSLYGQGYGSISGRSPIRPRASVVSATVKAVPNPDRPRDRRHHRQQWGIRIPTLRPPLFGGGFRNRFSDLCQTGVALPADQNLTVMSGSRLDRPRTHPPLPDEVPQVDTTSGTCLRSSTSAASSIFP